MGRGGPHVLSVDIGSSSVRAGLHGPDGTAVAGTGAHLRHQLRHNAAGAAELDPDELLERVGQVIDATLAARGGRRVEAVAMTTMWHSVCGVSATGEVTVPVLSWADQRSAPAAGELRGRLDDIAQHARTGTRLHSSYLPAKLAWLAHDAPERADRTARWLSPGEFVHLRMFGQATASVSMASGTGLMDQHTCRYDPALLAVLPGAESRLSPIGDDPVTGLAPPWRRRWPELADLPWYPAIGDGAASNAGVGATDPTRLAVMIGTSGAARVLCRAGPPRLPPGLWCYRLDRHHVLVGGAVNDGGALVDWLRATLRLPDPDAAEAQLAAVDPGGHGLTVLPLLAGERSLGWHDRARGAVAGLTVATTPVEVLRAAMEAAALRLAAVVSELDTTLPGSRAVLATGTALARSAAWRQILADALGRPVTASPVAEASSRGAALWVLHRLGVLGPPADWPAPDGARTEPDPARHRTYQRLLAEQQRLYELLA